MLNVLQKAGAGGNRRQSGAGRLLPLSSSLLLLLLLLVLDVLQKAQAEIDDKVGQVGCCRGCMTTVVVRPGVPVV